MDGSASLLGAGATEASTKCVWGAVGGRVQRSRHCLGGMRNEKPDETLELRVGLGVSSYSTGIRKMLLQEALLLSPEPCGCLSRLSLPSPIQ